MYADVTLKAEEFKTIHNALWHIQYSNEPDVESQVELIRKALRGCYEQDQEAFRILSAHYHQVRRELGLDAFWSIYKVKDLNTPHPYQAAKTVTYVDYWADDEGEYYTPPHIVVPIHGNTYAALYVAANAAIRDSGDLHHLFIEGFRTAGDTLILNTGS